MPRKKSKVVREETTVDHETGEITRRTTVLQFGQEPNYVKLYLDCLGVVLDNQGLNVCFNDMLVEVLKLANYADEGQHVILNDYHKNIICKHTKKGPERLKKAIKAWTDNGVLKRLKRGVYQINPYIFGKGEWRDIKGLRATFDFAAGEVITEREYSEEMQDSGGGTA